MKDSADLCRKLTGGLAPHLESRPLSPALVPIRTRIAVQSSISPGEGLLLLQRDNSAKVVKDFYRVLVTVDHHTPEMLPAPTSALKGKGRAVISPPHWH